MYKSKKMNMLLTRYQWLVILQSCSCGILTGGFRSGYLKEHQIISNKPNTSE